MERIKEIIILLTNVNEHKKSRKWMINLRDIFVYFVRFSADFLGVSYLPMQNVRLLDNQLITDFGLKWGEEF